LKRGKKIRGVTMILKTAVTRNFDQEGDGFVQLISGA
jgi:hypothetical protein